MGRLGRTAVAQPWPFGTEIGVVDLTLGSEPIAALPYGVAVAPAGPWKGPGADVLERAGAEMLGTLAEPLTAHAGGPAPLADFLGRAVRRAGGGHFGLAYATCGEPAATGVFAALPRGRVQALQLAQVTPWTNGAIVWSEMDGGEYRRFKERLAEKRYSHYLAFGSDAEMGAGIPDTVRVSTLAGYATVTVDAIVGRGLAWSSTGATLDDAVREALLG